jgi:protein ImuA
MTALDRIRKDLKRTLAQARPTVLDLGEAGLASVFPGGGLAAGAHEVAAAAPGDEASALAFATTLTVRALAAAGDARALLVQSAEAGRETGWAYGAGLQALGLDPDRLAVVAGRSGAEALRVTDEALRSGAVAVVLADLWEEPRLDLSATRRFNLACERTGGIVLLVTRDLDKTSAALTRWRVGAAPSVSRIGRARLERPAFHLQLWRNRMGPTGEWTVEWDSDDRVFRTPTPLPLPVVRSPADRSDAARPPHAHGVRSAGPYRQTG